MLNTKNIVTKIEDIPSYWIFQHYLNIQEQLTGQDIKIKSIFNPTENTPSFCVYVDTSVMQYKFKDFSTGKQGSKIDLIMYLYDVSFHDATLKIVDDYNEAIKNGNVEHVSLAPEPKWEMNIVKTRKWNEDDAKYWLSFNIGSSILEKFNVRPLDYYTMERFKNNVKEELKFDRKNTYGYFNKSDELIKIYQPFNSKYKFFNVQDYMQGFDQLSYSEDFLVICSSLKDAMCLNSFDFKLDVLAPASENAAIKPYVINNLKTKYKKIITLFDNDEAGQKAIEKYKKLYEINGCYYNRNKDISDATKEHGVQIVKKELKSLLIETLKQ